MCILTASWYEHSHGILFSLSLTSNSLPANCHYFVTGMVWLSFLGGILPHFFFVGINKCIRKRLPQLYIRWKFFMIHVLLTWEFFWQRNDAITFFIFICISRYLEFFFKNHFKKLLLPLVGSIMAKFEQMLWGCVGNNYYFEMLRV